jgi:predicted dehydrogenase
VSSRKAINANKSVFIEKPLALNQKELDQIIEAYNVNNVNITVGFNRRFAPLAKKMKKALGSSTTPINIVATMNAGFIPLRITAAGLI